MDTIANTSRIAIIGAGISGLTTGIILKRAGLDFIIYEADETIRGIGAGMGLASNAMKAFEYLELDQKITEISQPLETFQICDPKGKALIKIDTERIEKTFGTGNFSVHRADLHRILSQKIPSENIKVNKKVTHLDNRENEVKLHFSDNSEEVFDYVIGADGVNSKVRQSLNPDSTPRYAGYWCWRGVLKTDEFASYSSRAYWGHKGRFGITPLIDNQIYWFACINTPLEDRIREYSIEDLRKQFKSYPREVFKLLASTPEDKVINGPIMDIDPLKQFAYNRVLLIGDAAHATTPNMGQGACMAVEDVAVLWDELKTNDLKTAFVNFEKRRLQRTKYIIKNSRRAGKIAQSSNSFVNYFRNNLFRILPAGITQMPLQRLYDEDFMKK